MTIEDLDALERRVCEKWAAAAAARDQWETVEFDMSAWMEMDVAKMPLPANALEMSTVGQPLPPILPDTPQFPREQWASYPNRRRIALMVVDHALDLDELTDEQWIQVCMVMWYGGKTRLA